MTVLSFPQPQQQGPRRHNGAQILFVATGEETAAAEGDIRAFVRTLAREAAREYASENRKP